MAINHASIGMSIKDNNGTINFADAKVEIIIDCSNSSNYKEEESVWNKGPSNDYLFLVREEENWTRALDSNSIALSASKFLQKKIYENSLHEVSISVWFPSRI